jgi:hypothetical protein
MEEVKKEKAGVFALIMSFLIPVIGIICYFTNKNEVENASSYLWASLGGFVIGVIFNMIA